jgi:hypothetical protein
LNSDIMWMDFFVYCLVGFWRLLCTPALWFRLPSATGSSSDPGS